jgi:pSer/pThr/pTyr-binding forkhead associated (FHA) protein
LAYVIVTLHGKELQRRKLDGPLTIGRSLEADITLEDGAVSRQNSRIEAEGEKWFVADLKSRNGTRVNGKEIERHELRQGDVIAVGHTKLTFHAGKFVGPRPSDPAAALLSETTMIMPASRREASSRTLPTPKIGRVDVKPLPQQANGSTPLPFTRPPARPIVKREE